MTAYAYARTEYDARRNPAEPFEWEELPSLGSYVIAAGLVAEASARLRSEPSFSPVWVETMPGALDPLMPSSPLCETELGGLDAREINEPDVFRHFFGNGPR